MLPLVAMNYNSFQPCIPSLPCNFSNFVFSGYNKLCRSLVMKLSFMKINRQNLVRVDVPRQRFTGKSFYLFLIPDKYLPLGKIMNIILVVCFINMYMVI